MCIAGIDDPQCSKPQLEDNEDCYPVEMIEEENEAATSTWADWTPAKLNSKKSKELQVSKNDKDEDSLSLEDVERILVQSSKENCNPVRTNSSPNQSLKRKKSKQLQINANKRNERYYDLAQSKLQLVEVMKEDHHKKTSLEIAVLEMQLKKESLNVKLLEKQLNSYEKK
ncbi:PREDICTED: uncharacterized protein LOC105570831 [Vollenhovia emeryi]|uniref:uncharacterized protein LOC105570831 n=1 Tax=Vollenhovia emeryi TaxID=411798 RepID=UPI0005F4FCC0|nr:PREDICTED: uncharacterized protein LOC105570831 [Vollenhovia emeryi]